MLLKICLREEISKTIIIIKLGKMVKEEACSMISAPGALGAQSTDI